MSIHRAIAHRLGYDLRRRDKSDSLDEHLSRFFSRHTIDVVLDCGAFIGKFGQRLRQSGYKGPIISFEPSAKQFQQLAAAASRDPAWRTLQIALGDADETRTINVSPGKGDLNSLYKPHEKMTSRFEGLEFNAAEQINVSRLDGVLTQEGVPSDATLFVKSDTQGNDLSVLRGLGSRMASVKGVLLEMSVQPLYHGTPSHWETLEFLRAAGFEPYGFSSVSRDATGALIEYDAVFRRARA